MTNQSETVSVRLVFQVEEPVYLENQHLESCLLPVLRHLHGVPVGNVGHISFVFLYEILRL